MSTRRILGFSSIRSDYDLLSNVYKKLQNQADVELGLIVSGSHLSETYGNSVKLIENDDIPIIDRIDCLLESDRRSSRLKSAALLLLKSIGTIESWRPDLLIYSGDREDALIYASIGGYLGIPTVHFFGGDHTTDGNIDNAVRHAVSKLTNFHFVAHPSHRERLIAMGEEGEKIFYVGSPALEKFLVEPEIHKQKLLSSYQCENWNEFAVMIFHPILGSETSAGEQFETILKALEDAKIPAFVSHPNIDAGNKSILEMINRYAGNPNFRFIKNVNRSDFVNLLRQANFLIGNSSAGILEAPILKLGVINVGERQRGRKDCGNVLFVDSTYLDVSTAIAKVRSPEFKKHLGTVVSEYGDGKAVDRIVELLKTIPTDLKSSQKRFDPLSREGSGK